MLFWRRFLIILALVVFAVTVFLAYNMGYSSGKTYGVENHEQIKKEELEKTKEGDLTNLIFGLGDANKPVAVVTTVKNQTVPITVDALGTVSAASLININAEVQGVIKSGITLKKGSTFKKGQVLFSIKNDDILTALKARKSNFISMITQVIPDLKLDFPDRFDDWAKFYTSVEVNKPLPPMPKTKSLKEKNFMVSRGIYTEYYSILSEQERLQKYTVRAPFDGSIINAFMDVGAMVNPGSPVLSVIRNGEMEIEIAVPSSEVDLVKEGALVNISDDIGNVAQGVVSRMGQYINPQTQTIPVFIEVKESEMDLYNGMIVNVSIQAEGIEEVTKLPRKALIAKKQVYKIKEGKIIPSNINVKRFTKDAIIVKGLKDGEVIVVEPIINAQDSMAVEITKTP